ncbi:glycosyltransferase family 2 protein [Actinomycetospora chiangmaiensis]|uniref:glycosyltransferase family 2 protein n=1 Tax=Actinomycetospora chiangmaiensis TaxID=402650 RepID=UPI000379B678|nr:glycosyltransferase family A protein [Actinomycetospora chiangmaiensis]
MSTPRVSVCIPVYQGEDTLAVTMGSVLAQTFTDFELVVLDNGCTDRSGEIARSFDDPRVRVERNEETLPVNANWNRVVALSRAPLIKFLCADDLIHPQCLEIQVPLLDADASLSLVAHRQHLVDAHGRMIAPGRALRGLLGKRSRRQVLRRVVRSGANPIGSSSGLLFRRAAFEATEGFRRDPTFVTDLDLFLQLLEYGPMLGMPESLAAFRVSPGTITADAGRRIYVAQRAYTQEVAARSGVRRVDRVVASLAAPGARRRREAAYFVGRLGHRRTPTGAAT